MVEIFYFLDDFGRNKNKKDNIFSFIFFPMILFDDFFYFLGVVGLDL